MGAIVAERKLVSSIENERREGNRELGNGEENDSGAAGTMKK